jgi:predicted porin
LESGFNVNNGAQQYTNAMFGRQSWIGLTNQTFGTLTLGRQYMSYYTLMAPYSPTNWLTGYFGAHPGDRDALDTIYRANNSIVYTSPKLYGVTLSGSYSLAGVPDSGIAAQRGRRQSSISKARSAVRLRSHASTTRPSSAASTVRTRR